MKRPRIKPTPVGSSKYSAFVGNPPQVGGRKKARTPAEQKKYENDRAKKAASNKSFHFAFPSSECK